MEDRLSWHDTHPRFTEDFVDYIAMFAPTVVSVCNKSRRTVLIEFAYHDVPIELSRQFDCEQFPEGARWTFDQVPVCVWRTMCFVGSGSVIRVSDKLLRNRKSKNCYRCSGKLDTHWLFCRKCRSLICHVRHLPRCLMMARVDGLLPDVTRLICRRLIELTLLTNGQC